MVKFITKSDHGLMRRINQWAAPRWVRLWMVASSRGGDGWLWCSMGLLVLLFGGPSRFDAFSAAAVSAGSSILMFLGLKRLTARIRPCELMPHCWARLLPPDRFSFPSGHSITAFGVATPLALFYPSLWVGLLFCAASIAISRLVLGLHFLSDVLVGSALGVSLGYGAYLVFT